MISGKDPNDAPTKMEKRMKAAKFVQLISPLAYMREPYQVTKAMVPKSAKMMKERNAARWRAPRMVTSKKRLQRAVVAVVFELLVAEGFHVGDALHGFLDDGAGLGERVLRVAGEAADFPAEERDGEHDDRHAAEHDEREFPRGDEDENQAADEDDGVAHGLRHGVEQGVADDAEIGGNAVAEGAGALLLIERHRAA